MHQPLSEVSLISHSTNKRKANCSMNLRQIRGYQQPYQQTHQQAQGKRKRESGKPHGNKVGFHVSAFRFWEVNKHDCRSEKPNADG
jgi:hypothetical protein